MKQTVVLIDDMITGTHEKHIQHFLDDGWKYVDSVAQVAGTGLRTELYGPVLIFLEKI